MAHSARSTSPGDEVESGQRIEVVAIDPGNRAPLEVSAVEIVEERAGMTMAAAAEPRHAMSILVMMVHWSESDAQTQASVYQQVGVDDAAWFARSSTATSGSPPRSRRGLRSTRARTCTDYQGLATRARTAAVNAGYNPANFTNEMIYFPNQAECFGSAGKGSIAGYTTWINGYMDLRVTTHEIGHNLGLRHANTLTCVTPDGTRTQLSDGCTEQEYGDFYDAMGQYSPFHFSGLEKDAVGMLPGGPTIVSTSTTVTISPLEQADGIESVRLDAAPGAEYWLEYTMTWTPPTSNGGSAITAYRVSRSAYGTHAAFTTTLAASARTQTMQNLTAGGTYTLSVEAINAIDTGPAASGTVTINGGTTVPGVPNGSTLTAGGTYTLSVEAINAIGTGPAASVSVTISGTSTVPGAPVFGTSVAGAAGGAITPIGHHPHRTAAHRSPATACVRCV